MKTTAAQIREAKAEGTMSRVSGTNQIVFSNGVVFEEETQRNITSLWNKLRKMGYDIVRNSESNEIEGYCQANELGLNFPEPTMLINN